MKVVKEVLPQPRKHWVGNAFHVFPVFAHKAFSEELSPFLMFDYAAPKVFEPSTAEPRGVGKHPHRGFETVTIAFQGEVQHHDNKGNSGIIGPGDVQWMTAASGIVHEEYHSKAFAARGGSFEMCQIWVNLPAEHKMSKPRYQPILHADITTSPLWAWEGEACAAAASPAAEGEVRVIAGQFHDAKGPARTSSQVDMWDVSIKATEKSYVFDTVPGNTVIVFVRRGGVDVQGRELGPQDVALLHGEASMLIMRALKPDTQLLVLAGAPLNEPIASQGPMVMNTQAELQQAFHDYHAGKFGRT